MNEILATEYLKQGEVLLENGKDEYSLQYFKKAEQENPFSSVVYIGMGIAYTNMEQYGQAEDSFLKALKVNSEEGNIYFHLGNINFLKNEKVKGIQYYNQAIAKGYDESQLYYNLGIVYEEEGEDILALRNYSKAIIKAPLRGEIRLRKAQLYIKQKKYHEAVQALEEMTLECPDYFEGYHMKIRLFGEMEEYDKSLAAVEEARRIFPEDSGFVLDQANLYADLNRFDEALEVLEAEEGRIGNGLDKREVAIERARIYALKGNMQETISNLIKAKEASNEKVPPESDPAAEYFLLNCYISVEDYEKALDSASSLKGIEEMGYYTLAAYYYEPYCLQKLQREKESKELYQVGVEKLRSHTLEYPHHLDAYFFRILCLKNLKMYDKALELSDYIIKVKDDSAEFYAIREMLLSEMGREEEAKEARAKSRSLGGITALLLANGE